jgi:hypothetical protein
MLVHEFTYSHPSPYRTASMLVLSITSRGKAMHAIEILIDCLFFWQLVSANVCSHAMVVAETKLYVKPYIRKGYMRVSHSMWQRDAYDDDTV